MRILYYFWNLLQFAFKLAHVQMKILSCSQVPKIFVEGVLCEILLIEKSRVLERNDV